MRFQNQKVFGVALMEVLSPVAGGQKKRSSGLRRRELPSEKANSRVWLLPNHYTSL